VPKQNFLADPNLGRFIDDETEIEFIQSRVKKSSNAAAPAKDFDSENGIPNLPKIERKSSFTPVILIQNTNADYQILDLGLTIILDKNLQNVGIWIPETVLDEDIKVRYHSRFFVQAGHEITYRIVASTNTCYYSENQAFGGVTIRVLCSKRGCY
jgi:hypothetical protein